MSIRQKKVFFVCAVLLLIVVFSQFALAKTTITWRMGTWWNEAAPVAVEKFEKENPDIDVTVELIPFQGWAEAAIIAAMGPQPPDVMEMVGEVGDMPLLADKGLLEVLDPYMEKTGIDPNDFFPGVWQIGQFKGKTIAIPFRIWSGALYYNVKMFKEAGLDPDNPPKTWDEILEYAKKMTNREEGKYGLLIPASMKTVHPILHVLFAVIRAKGGSILNEDWTKAAIDSPEAKAGVQFWADLSLKHQVVPDGIMTYDGNDVARLFGAGNIGMIINGVEGVGNISETAAEDFEYRISVSPAGTEVGGCTLAIPTHAQNKEAAWRFIDWFTDPENLPELTIRTPSTRSAVVHPKWATPVNKTFFESAEISYAYPVTQIPEWKEIGDIIIQHLQQILLGKQSVDESMDETARLINELLE